VAAAVVAGAAAAVEAVADRGIDWRMASARAGATLAEAANLQVRLNARSVSRFRHRGNRHRRHLAANLASRWHHFNGNKPHEVLP
jgi:argininosuccinate lyase